MPLCTVGIPVQCLIMSSTFACEQCVEYRSQKKIYLMMMFDMNATIYQLAMANRGRWYGYVLRRPLDF